MDGQVRETQETLRSGMMTLDERKAQLLPKLTPEFLATLAEAVRVVGWEVDAHETTSLVKVLHDYVGSPRPDDLSPYEDE
jgi:hypothetical protein